MTLSRTLAIVLGIVLALSLAANFFIVGFAAARIAEFRGTGPIERIIALGIRPYPPEIRRAILAEALSERVGLRTALADFRSARQRLFAKMKANPFDRAALDAAFTELRAKTDALERIGQTVLTEAISDATPAARAAIKPAAGFLP
jgi:hypothetical protein